MPDNGRADQMIAENLKMFGPKSCCCKCWDEFRANSRISDNPAEWMVTSSAPFILCPTCGNKRCPKASDHTLACTGSNASGQPGSVYK